MDNINLISACSDLGVHICGCENGPLELTKDINIKNYIIKKDNIEKSLDNNDLRKNEIYINKFTKEVFDTSLSILKDNKIPLLIGGDHSCVMGNALASQKHNKNIGIIWVDAHIDYNTFDTTITGNIHGLPLAAINGICEDLTKFVTNNYINPKNTVVVGYRAKEDNCDLEMDNIKKMGVTVFTTDDIKLEGASNIMKKAIDIASHNTNGIHISLDLDVIDPIISPGVSIPEENGINEKEINEIVDEVLNQKELVKSLDLVEFNPAFDKDNKTKNIALNILNKIIKE